MPKTTISDEQRAESEQRLRDRDKGALMDVLFYYIFRFRGIGIPMWVTVEFIEAYAKVHDEVMHRVGMMFSASLGQKGI